MKNTLMFRFPEGAAGPSVVEIARFVKAFDADKFTMECSYKISEERCICIKFMNERAMKDALMQNPENHVFQYSNGQAVEVKMAVAGGCSKYIRIFDLPPEVPDQEIATVLGRYGIVRRMVREKFPAQLELDLTTGVRGAHIEVKKEIPATLFFLNRRGRIYYEGVKHKCFLCKEEGHLKAECPRNKKNTEAAGSVELANGLADPSASTSTPQQSTFAAVLKSKTPDAGAVERKMTLLVPAAKVAAESVCNVDKEKPSNIEEVADKPQDTVALTDEIGADIEDLPDPIEMEVEDLTQASKRQHDSSSTEEEGNTRSSRTRKQKKDVDPLEIIASVPVQPKGKGRNKSKN